MTAPSRLRKANTHEEQAVLKMLQAMQVPLQWYGRDPDEYDRSWNEIDDTDDDYPPGKLLFDEYRYRVKPKCEP